MPPSLTIRECLWFFPVLRILVICPNLKVSFPNKIVTPFFKCPNNSQKFLVINGVIPLRKEWDKKVHSLHLPSSPLSESTALMAMSLASVSTHISLVVSEYASSGAVVNLFLMVSKGSYWAWPHCQGVSFWVRSLRGHAICPKLLINHW